MHCKEHVPEAKRLFLEHINSNNQTDAVYKDVYPVRIRLLVLQIRVDGKTYDCHIANKDIDSHVEVDLMGMLLDQLVSYLRRKHGSRLSLIGLAQLE